MTDSRTQANERGLLDVQEFVIPRSVLEETISFLRAVGTAGAEGFVLWGGNLASRTCFRFTTALVPEQQPFGTPQGLLVTVGGDALFSINKTLFERGEILGAQVHTHPTSAYHSETDDHYPMVTLLGALSVVIPDFAQHAPSDMPVWAWYRLKAFGNWIPLEEGTLVTLE